MIMGLCLLCTRGPTCATRLSATLVTMSINPATPQKSALALPALWSEAEAYFSKHSVRLHLGAVAGVGSRTTSRVAVRALPESPKVHIGLFKPGTHDVIPCHLDESCYLPHHPAINEAITAVSRELSEFGELSAYDEALGQGTLRYLQLSVERSSGRVQLTLVVNCASLGSDPCISAFTERLWRRYASSDCEQPLELSRPSGGRRMRLHSLWVNLNPSAFNNIVSYSDHAWKLTHSHKQGQIEGGSLLEQFRSGASFFLPPFVFRQANLDGFDRIVAQVVAAVAVGCKVVEWYAGVGVLGLSLAPVAEWVRCSDVNQPHDAFEASRALLPHHVQSRVSYAVGAAADRLIDAIGADVAVVDPPRKGLDDKLLAALCERDDASACARLHTLVYVSCGFPALMRDADALLASGWRVRGSEATAHILFMGANHLETVVVFERVLGDTLPTPARASEDSELRSVVRPLPSKKKDGVRPNKPQKRRKPRLTATDRGQRAAG